MAPARGAARGGYESANLRLSLLLRSCGAEVLPLAYPPTLGLGAVAKLLRYRKGFAGLRRDLAAEAGRGDEGAASPRLVHFTPLFRQFALQELRLLRQARAAGFGVVLDLRAGNKLRDHDRFGPAYRALLAACLRQAHVIAHEGQEQAAAWQRLAPGKPLAWLPNFVSTAEREGARPERDAGVVRLVHLGTVSPAKGVDDAIAVADALVGLGLRVRFDVIGRAAPGYGAELQTRCRTRPWVRLHGPMSPQAARPLLDRAQVFLFLTRWRGEGQSNALTEAMARGCVPVVTRHGFNASVVGDCGVLVGNRGDHGPIAARIARLIHQDGGRARAVMARRAIARVEARFTEAAVLPILLDLYRQSTRAAEKDR
ncbi:hypothetical protein BV394_03390 [Brevirhabdus pacifica]|uniref:Glycosyltransferase involved in cell wall biosynthesis n=1 Tax=Brevirhabdus pacifica TaxID=1267768 RepID=A0A1U7DFW1_9RHOB|nr:hypothetical protein BV394_03390 [Brevirhabdus pacifica]OWU80122.1 hypothetical protein ATO5_04075 [Loktanella sp. 22II-4b]